LELSGAEALRLIQSFSLMRLELARLVPDDELIVA
jgi:hypothetical protein